jgi:hypothetical protein
MKRETRRLGKIKLPPGVKARDLKTSVAGGRWKFYILSSALRVLRGH